MASTGSNGGDGYRTSDAAGPSEYNISGVLGQLQDLKEVVRRQKEVINQLQTSLNGTQSSKNTHMGSASCIKAPAVICYSGKVDLQTAREKKSKASST